MYSHSNCFHLGQDLAGVTGLIADVDGMTVPLNKKLLSYKGEAIFTPLQRIGVSAGFSGWRRSDGCVSGSSSSCSPYLNVHWFGSSMSNLLAPQGGYNPAYYIGPADGRTQDYIPSSDGRSVPFDASADGQQLYEAAAAAD